MKLYKSEISKGLLIFIISIIVTNMGIMLWIKSWPGLLILLLLAFFILHLFLNTNYRIDRKTLIIKCGFIYRNKIEIDRIKKISSTKSILSAPALSLDRLEIFYQKYDSVVVSPENKISFIEDLKKVNPTIEVTL